jgi:3-oxoadipate enol-lactonase
VSLPDPPAGFPPGRILHVPGRGEFFLRDSGGTGRPVLLLHGWMFSADLNWRYTYDALRSAGYRVLAVDHRGHGRGLRTPDPFRLEDCAADAAAVVRTLGVGAVTAVGYSMGGPIAQLMARDHRDVVSGLVLCATAADWQDPGLRLFWRTMGSLRLLLGLFPMSYWQWLVRVARLGSGAERTWIAAELSRGSSIDLAEAGRELSRYDARPWLDQLRGLPAAVVLTTKDRQVFPRKQRRLAEALGAPTFEVPAGHFAVTTHQGPFRRALLEALAAVTRTAPPRGLRRALPSPVASHPRR